MIMRHRRRMLMQLHVGYTGNYTDEIVTMGGTVYRLLTLISSGTLTLSRPVTADLCVVGAGVGGFSGYTGGGAGGKLVNSLAVSEFSSGLVTIGAPGRTAGATSIGTLTSGVSGGTGGAAKSGGTGAGGGGHIGLPATEYEAGNGDGLSKYPFNASSYFDRHCGAGGGGPMQGYGGATSYKGGVGGSNGADGSPGRAVLGTGTSKGGAMGGGTSGTPTTNGQAATFYGSGGGGGGGRFVDEFSFSIKSVGAGYQGVAYVRIPIAV